MKRYYRELAKTAFNKYNQRTTSNLDWSCVAQQYSRKRYFGRIKQKKQSGRPRCRTLDWVKKRDNGYTYQSLKEIAQCRTTWSNWCLKPALGQRT